MLLTRVTIIIGGILYIIGGILYREFKSIILGYVSWLYISIKIWLY